MKWHDPAVQSGRSRCRLAIGWWLALAGWLALAWSPVAAEELRIVGSDWLGDDVVAALRELGRRHDLALNVELAGSRAAGAELVAGRAEIGLVVRLPGEPPADDTCLWRPLAYAATFVVVPREMPLAQITPTELAGIFGATARASPTRWGELGLGGEWSTRTITPHVMSERMGWSVALFRDRVLQGGGLRATVQSEESPAVVVRKMAAERGGIALVGALPDEAGPLKALPVGGVIAGMAATPTAANLHSGDYPLRLLLWLVVRRDVVQARLAFLRDLCGDELAAVLARAELVPVPAAVRMRLRLELEGG